jgi:hypothetical protein
MEWRFFLGASFLTGALIVPFAGVRPVAAGLILGAAIRGGWWLIHRDPRV